MVQDKIDELAKTLLTVAGENYDENCPRKLQCSYDANEAEAILDKSSPTVADITAAIDLCKKHKATKRIAAELREIRRQMKEHARRMAS